MTKARAAEVARQYEQGKSLDTLIAEFDSSYFSVRKAILDNGVTLRPKNITMKKMRKEQEDMKAARWTSDHLRMAMAEYETSGLKAVGEKLGFSATYISTKLKEAGVKLKPAHRTNQWDKASNAGNTTSATQNKLYSFGKFQSINLRVSV
jgi:transposase